MPPFTSEGKPEHNMKKTNNTGTVSMIQEAQTWHTVDLPPAVGASSNT